MNRISTCILVTTFSGACALQAQTANPMSTELKQIDNGTKNNLLKIDNKVP